jgi:hypothetical protein
MNYLNICHQLSEKQTSTDKPALSENGENRVAEKEA